MRVLIADDEATSRMILEDTLTIFGEVRVCSDGTEAVDLFQHALALGAGYDLVCLDIMMPGMSGLIALRLMRDLEARRGRVRPNAAKIIMATSASNEESISEAFRGLCDAYVMKPIDPAELTKMVECLCCDAELEGERRPDESDFKSL